ncbi:acyltransferase family protein [Sphingomonas sp.]|jgi:peptidoglycan/LPS O-acetylase OafA/YrhL|uniref:acyltransferase family protein n=1 Tax=Sphingomonas sp. TaxID=28214 RepID=UPI00262E7540|nr:acyltransferase family protein [Sphingomonas sp.]MDF2603024.1 acyltransferase 3 [Sphingomonas sp.]
MQFRSDIAGLRAVAVLPIVLFHAGLESLPGGFVGVDVFFVISGFLITSLIVRDLESDSFSVWTFYRRRVSRIVPALLVVVLATLAAGYFTLLPPELSDLATSAIFALSFLSNFYFLFTADYFATASQATPLLHTWSLAVEEQFYIFYPIMLLVLWRWKPQRMAAAVIICVLLSFVAALGMAAYRSELAFYLLPARAWELGAGALVAMKRFPHISSPRGRQMAAGAGLALIVGSIIFVEEGPLFPAPLAAFSVLGTALLIAYGEGAFTHRILALPPLQWVGNISYSLYLWHWPVITFYRLHTGFDLDIGETIGLVFASIALATATYVWVERPSSIRLRPREILSDRFVTLSGLAALVFTMAIAAVTPVVGRATRTFPADATKIATYMDYSETADYRYQFRRGVCFMSGDEGKKSDLRCLATSPTNKDMLVLGDSHAAHLWRAVSEKYTSYNVIQATASGCRPLVNGDGADVCTDLMKHVFDKLLPTGEIETVVLAGRWKPYEVSSLRDTVDWLARKNVKVVVLGPTIEYQGDFPALLARAVISGGVGTIDRLRVAEREQVEDSIGDALKGSAALYIPLHPLLCPNGKCPLLTKTGEPYHFDYGHFTLAAAREVVGRLPPFVGAQPGAHGHPPRIALD